jgi:hypothetical protein
MPRMHLSLGLIVQPLTRKEDPLYFVSLAVYTAVYTLIHTYIHTYIYIRSTDPVSASVASEFGTCQETSDNTRHVEKIHLQDKRVNETKNKINTFTGVNQSITPGHHSQWNNFLHKAYSNEN